MARTERSDRKGRRGAEPQPHAELVFANVLDGRYYDAQGVGGQPLVFTLTVPGRALPFAVVRQWKAPQGVVTEGFRLVAPSGRVAYERADRVRRMPGMMDLTEIVDVVDDAIMPELGIYVGAFIVGGEVQGEVDFQVAVQAPATSLPKEIEDDFRKTDVLWVGVREDGRDVTIPAWFVYKDGRIYLLHTDDPATHEQVVPGLPDAPELIVITRHKYRETRHERFPAAVRIIPPDSAEYDGLVTLLADRRRDRHGPPQDAIKKWKSEGALIAELTPAIPA